MSIQDAPANSIDRAPVSSFRGEYVLAPLNGAYSLLWRAEPATASATASAAIKEKCRVIIAQCSRWQTVDGPRCVEFLEKKLLKG